MEIKTAKKINCKYVRIHAKIRDEGTYFFLDENKKEIFEKEGYVPGFFPYGEDGNGRHYGDYLDLWIDIDTGQIINWKKNIKPEEIEAQDGE